tara:strand:- start:91 stop:411 length:321 start_codon:yes stop_codon:yes gene_type:complete
MFMGIKRHQLTNFICLSSAIDYHFFMQPKELKIDDIYVPIKRRATRNQQTVDALAAAILEDGQKVPIQVRQDGKRLVLIEGLHRLEACRALGEDTVLGILVRARLH